jgi:hypothetical protein
MLLSKRFLEYSSFEITPVGDLHQVSATFLILKVFKGFKVNSFDKQLVKQLSKSFDDIRICEPEPNYTETFTDLPEPAFRYTWREIQCTSKQNLTQAEFLSKVYAAYEICYERSFISSVSVPVPA